MSAAGASARPARPDALRRRAFAAASLLGLAAITVWAYVRTGFSLGELLGNTATFVRLAGELWPPDWNFWSRLTGPLVETLEIAVLGTVVGAALALPLSVLAARPIAPTAWTYRIARAGMNLLRTMPDLFWAMIFASAIGIGPFAGVLALSVFTVAVVSKLLSESTEAIDLRVLEAVRAVGGGWRETVRFAVWPQILPHFVSYALYAFEINVRASTVLGLVGAGGLGVVLRTQLAVFRYDRVMLIVIVVFAVVLVIERISEWARRRLV